MCNIKIVLLYRKLILIKYIYVCIYLLRDQKIIELLYAEAKYNVLQGRYPVEVNHCLMLASLQCRIELGPNNLQQYTSSFFR